MLRIFQDDIARPDKFVITLELVPGRQSTGKDIDTLTGIARDAFADGRLSAVSITDNPGGNPSLSPDVIGYEIFRYGMDVIVHFTCRDMNRAGMESRALQLARMGMKNILALTGDYAGRGFGGRGAPVFDLDSVLLTSMLRHLNRRLNDAGDPDGFFTGCAVSPFKTTEAECAAQYRKLAKKIEFGASFVITQLGYDVGKFRELITHSGNNGHNVPMIGSVYMLSPRAAKVMNQGRVPGAFVSDDLYRVILQEWKDPGVGLSRAIDRAAKLGVILKGLGYRGIHIGGIHRNFDSVGAILDRMGAIEHRWEEFVHEFNDEQNQCFYLYDTSTCPKEPTSPLKKTGTFLKEHLPYRILDTAHSVFFTKKSLISPMFRRFAGFIDRAGGGRLFKLCFEDPVKKPVLSCRSCGDCAIQHVAFLCPESGCPKHIRNGPCGGSRNNRCEVYPDRLCIWVRAYTRLARRNLTETICRDKVPPRMWELDRTSSWLNFHLDRDHQRTTHPHSR